MTAKKQTTMTLAYCYASGQIGFASQCPDGALPLMRGPDAQVRDVIGGHARHAYDGETLLVPGLPEAGNDQRAGLEALHAFGARLRAVVSDIPSIKVVA
jgi:hypothetical protein